MYTALLILHFFVCVLLSIVVLFQFGKGAEAGASLGGGGSQAIFTSSQKGNFFTKLTTVLAIVFMANSIVLSIMSTERSKGSSVFGDEAAPTQIAPDQAMEKAAEEAKSVTSDAKESSKSAVDSVKSSAKEAAQKTEEKALK